MDKFQKLYEKLMESMTSAILTPNSGAVEFGPDNIISNDKIWNPGDTRMPSFIGGKKGKKPQKRVLSRTTL